MRRQSEIVSCLARQVLNSSGEFTVEVEVELADGNRGLASAPRGTTTGRFDVPIQAPAAAVVRSSALQNCLNGLDAVDQRRVDVAIANRFGSEAVWEPAANLACAASMSVLTAAAHHQGVPVWCHLGRSYGIRPTMPQLILNVLNGGGHNEDTGSEVTEGLILLPRQDVSAALLLGTKFLHNLRGAVARRYGSTGLGSGREGGFTPPVSTGEQLLELIASVCCSDESFGELRIGFDMAGNWLMDRRNKVEAPDPQVQRRTMLERYLGWVMEWPLLGYLEDPFEDHDDASWALLTGALRRQGHDLFVAGDDLLATKVERLDAALRAQLINGAIAKVDQIGTLSQMADFLTHCRQRGVTSIVSHRSQETDQALLADLAVGFGADFLKAGCCSRERIIKYNRLLRIEDELQTGTVR